MPCVKLQWYEVWRFFIFWHRLSACFNFLLSLVLCFIRSLLSYVIYLVLFFFISDSFLFHFSAFFSISQHFTFHLLKYLGKSPSISTIGTRVCSQLWFSQSYILFATQFFARTLQNEMLSIPINPNCSTVNRIIK